MKLENFHFFQLSSSKSKFADDQRLLLALIDGRMFANGDVSLIRIRARIDVKLNKEENVHKLHLFPVPPGHCRCCSTFRDENNDTWVKSTIIFPIFQVDSLTLWWWWWLINKANESFCCVYLNTYWFVNCPLATSIIERIWHGRPMWQHLTINHLLGSFQIIIGSALWWWCHVRSIVAGQLTWELLE